jgi:hypothetical protein
MSPEQRLTRTKHRSVADLAAQAREAKRAMALASDEAKRLRDALERIVAAHIGNPTPIHHKVKEAINLGFEALKSKGDERCD